MKNVYFLSDAHLGSRAIEHSRTQERRLVNFLDSIKHKAAAVYLLGDIFDFWYEFRTVVPKGYTRFLGKLSELTDLGVEVHFFTGNHDLWCGDYLTTECGVIIHREPLTTEIYGKEFYLAHGDGLGDPDKKYRFLRSMFHSPMRVDDSFGWRSCRSGRAFRVMRGKLFLSGVVYCDSPCRGKASALYPDDPVDDRFGLAFTGFRDFIHGKETGFHEGNSSFVST